MSRFVALIIFRRAMNGEGNPVWLQEIPNWLPDQNSATHFLLLNMPVTVVAHARESACETMIELLRREEIGYYIIR
jgi:hypothetical protein